MRILGIETSCDETAVCLIEAHGDFGAEFKFEVLGNALISQAKLHEQYGGVFPNLAKREHAKNLVPLLETALKEAAMLVPADVRLTKSNIEKILEREPELLERLVPFLEHQKPDIDAIAVTHGPGLEPALWVGINFAKALSSVWNVPLVAVNHMDGHVLMSMMDGNKLSLFEFPLLALLISGGHTELVLSREFGKYQLIGQTRDDAAGEAFDKVARLLELGYPGGPEISRLAAEARNSEMTSHCNLPRPMLHEDNLDFSFSGLKTAVRNIVEKEKPNDTAKMNIAREFEDAVTDVLVTKTLRAVEQYGVSTVVVGGGVSANTHIRAELAKQLRNVDCQLLVPPPELATDNAIMIALAGYFHALKNDFVEPSMLVARGNLKLT